MEGINDQEIPRVASVVKDAGAFMHNIVPLIPVAGSGLANAPQTRMSSLLAMREKCQAIIPQMHHCRQCRADDAGLLAESKPGHAWIGEVAKERVV